MNGTDPFRWAAGMVLVFAATGAAAPSPDAIRGQREAVFQRPEFSSGAPRENWLLRALRDIFNWLGTLLDVSPVLFTVLVVVCITLLVLLIVHIVWQVRRAFAIARGIRPEESEAARRRVLSEAYREEALRRAEAGDYTEAVRHLFLSLVWRFDERGRISLNKSYTNREYLEVVNDRSPAIGLLRMMVDLLDIHWYGQSRCDAAQYETCLNQYERLVRVM